ncbi:MAG: FtsX-like permease family protein, partial [Desulfobacterales bacterium]|nr:FtsX-like permease family protein [Desulfobacterales bacterium]
SSIGILSTMLVSIVERTREIGLRRSLGASRMSVLRQILIESIIISFIGGILGIIIAFFTVKPIINELLLKVFFFGSIGIKANLSLYSALISLFSVVIIGILAGFYPGIQASRLTPVDAIKEG